jgi:hypothetical protein
MMVPATKVDDVGDHLDKPGAYDIRIQGNGEPGGMGFVCPCGCGREGYLPFKPQPSPSWTFDGNTDKPTLSPSVLQVGGCRWHGWLRAGIWVSC